MTVESQNLRTNWKHRDSASLISLLMRKVPEAHLSLIQEEILSLEQLIQESQGRDFQPDCQAELLRQRMLGSVTLDTSRLQICPEKDQIIVGNWLKANQQIASWIAAEELLSLAKIKKIHSLLEGSTTPSAWRNHAIFLADRENICTAFEKRRPCPSFEDLPTLMDVFMEYYLEYKDQLHPLVFAATVYQWLISIHPFENGNGRLARLILDWMLGAHGYPPVSFTQHEEAYAFLTPAIVENFPPGHETSVIIAGVRNTLRVLFFG